MKFICILILVIFSFSGTSCTAISCERQVSDKLAQFLSKATLETTNSVEITKSRTDFSDGFKSCFDKIETINIPMIGAYNRSALAIMSGDNSFLEKTIKIDHNPLDKLNLGANVSLMHLAGSYGNSETINILVAAGVPVSAEDALGQTPVFAVLHFQPDICATLNILIRHGADIEHKDSNGRTPLVLAVISGNSAGVRCLIENGAHTDTIFGGESLMDLASKKGLVEIMNLLKPKAL